MGAIKTIHNALYGLNNTIGKIARVIAMIALGLMVLVILLQVFFRYVLNNALPWPDEGARFLMLWMTGVLAPVAYREGGFVAIDMIEQILNKGVVRILSLILLALSLIVLVYGVGLGWNHVKSGTLFNSSSLKIPLGWFGGETIRIKLAWMYASLFVGVVLMTIANIELILRNLIAMTGGDDTLRPIPHAQIGTS